MQRTSCSIVFVDSAKTMSMTFSGEMMKRITTALLLAVLALAVRDAQAVTDADLQDTWISVSPTNHPDDMLGNVRWETVTFATNGLVTWHWQREGHTESHSGKYRLDSEPVTKPSYRQRFNVMIIPHTMAVRQPIVMKDVTVQIDNRFPDTWTVLKWRDVADNLTTFLREKHAKKWKPFAEEIGKADKALSPEAKAELDQLNFKCANSTAWSEEFDRLERPETRPPNYLVSGECRAFANDCKKRLAALGIKVKWNSEKKLYEAQE